MKRNFKFILPILLTIIFLFSRSLISQLPESLKQWYTLLDKSLYILSILMLYWSSQILIKLFNKAVLKKYNVNQKDNLKSRKVHTQVKIVERILRVFILLVAIGLILLSFESVRKIGVGLFASAGVAGIIIGLSAQRVVGAILAGLQIAFTQPFRIDDAVVVEGEWGWIEEINLTYVVIRIWDKRRLVLPSTYFLEKPFQNWTRNNAEILGTVFIYTDYSVPINDLRLELDKFLSDSTLWDGKVKVIQVTDVSEGSVESRILVSAADSPTAWDLRVALREHMITFIRENYPQGFPKTRVLLQKDEIVPGIQE